MYSANQKERNNELSATFKNKRNLFFYKKIKRFETILNTICDVVEHQISSDVIPAENKYILERINRYEKTAKDALPGFLEKLHNASILDIDEYISGISTIATPVYDSYFELTKLAALLNIQLGPAHAYHKDVLLKYIKELNMFIHNQRILAKKSISANIH